MNELEIVGVCFCVILGVALVWGILYFIFEAKSEETFEAAFGASLITIVFLIIALIITVSSFIESERKNDEYKDVISEYEENKEVEDADN